jgi:hypothetical protein
MAPPTHEELCRRIVHEMPGRVIDTDHGGVIQLWNAAATAMFG